MGQLISLLAVVLFSIASFAQNGLGPLAKTDFSPLINENILEQELAAEDLSQATQLASAKNAADSQAVDAQDEHALVESVKTVPTGNGEEALAAQQAAKAAAAAASEANARNPANEKDFQLKLHPTGLASAKRYFPPKPPKPPRVKAAKKSSPSSKIAKASKKSNKAIKASKSAKVAKKTSKKSDKVAKAEKKVKTKKSKNGRSTASIKKKSKNKKSTAQSASSGKI